MFLNYNQMEDLDQKFGSSFYLLNANKIRNNYKKIKSAFISRYNNFVIGYSYKTNYLPYLCKEMSKLGAYAEVVSRLEYDLALKIGVNPEKIIFNGPLKTYEDIKIALDNCSLLNIDSPYEVDYVLKYCRNNKMKEIKLGIRVNFDISTEGRSPLQEGYEISRFGICTENGDFQETIRKLTQVENIKIVGLHGHFSTSGRKVETYESITKGLCHLAKKYFKDTVEYIDVGGGFYGELPSSFKLQTPSFDDYAEAICKIMNIEFEYSQCKPTLIIEPGIAMVANTLHFIAKVIENKQIRGQYFVLIDGSVHNIKPTLHKRNLPMQMVKQREDINLGTYHIVGYTCMEKDYLAYGIQGEIPNRGDYIIFDNVGAYTIVFNPPFIKERPSIVAMDNSDFFVVRKKESIREFFNEDLYVFN